MSHLLQELWNLRTHPFRPEADPQGNPFEPHVWNAPFDPLNDPRFIPFYYDLYAWQTDSLIGRLLPGQLFESFPAKEDIDATGSVMVLITGNDNTGRESLQNLILHKVKTQYGKQPLAIKVSLVPNLLESLKRIRTLFSFRYSDEEAEPPAQKLQAAVASAADANGDLSVDAYQTLFQIWRSVVSAKCARPLVLLATGADDFDLWRQVYDAVSPLFDFIVILTKSEVRAETTDVLLKGNSRNSTVIKAQPLEAEAAEKYVRSKLASQRLAPVAAQDSFTPFAADVVTTLYERGAFAKPGEDVRWEVGWLNKTLSRALDEHLKTLLARQNAGTDVVALPREELLINGTAVSAAREKMNHPG